MYHPRSHDPDHWNPVTTPSLSAVIGFAATVVLLPVAATALAGHLAFVGGLLIGLGAIALVARLATRNRRPNDRHATNVPVWFAGLERTTGTQRQPDTQ